MKKIEIKLSDLCDSEFISEAKRTLPIMSEAHKLMFFEETARAISDIILQKFPEEECSFDRSLCILNQELGDYLPSKYKSDISV